MFSWLFSFLRKIGVKDMEFEEMRYVNERLEDKVKQNEETLVALQSQSQKDENAEKMKELNNANWDLKREKSKLQEDNNRLMDENKVLRKWNAEIVERFKERFPAEAFPIDVASVGMIESAQHEVERNNMLLNYEIDYLEMEMRSYNGLRRRGINTILELMSHDAEELLDETRNFGNHALNDVVIALAEYDLRLPGTEEGKMSARMRKILAPAMAKIARIESTRGFSPAKNDE